VSQTLKTTITYQLES